MQTAISTFGNYGTARSAVDRLVDAGFRRMDVHIDAGSDSQASSGPPRHEHDRTVLESIGHIFVSLFGKDMPHHEVQEYTEAVRRVRRGYAVVIVYVDNEQESQRAVQIMNELGAVHVKPHTQPLPETARI